MIETIQNSDGNPVLCVIDDNGNPVVFPAQPTSDPAAQREAAAAPAEPAAGPETPAPCLPRAMTKEEAAVRLCGLAAGTDDPATLRALLLGCKALCREGIHKRRNKASRAARGKEAV